MVNNRCASLGSLRSSISDVTSQTTSAEESNVLTASLTEERDTLKGLKFDPDHIDEVQSPERGLLESLLADHLEFGPDFMISSPRRDYMVCSPRRDFMLISSPKREFPVTSPRRDYMLSSPKRECMFLSPRRSNGVGSINNLPPALIHPSYSSLSHHGNGKSQSPLNKVCNSSSASLYATYSSAPAEYLHPETLALPAVEAFFEDYGREGYDVHSPALKYTGVGNEFSAETFAPPAPAAMPSLLDCFVMESRYGGSEGEMMAAGIQLSEDDDELYRHFGGGAAAQAQYQEPAPQQKTEIGHGFLSSVASNSSANITTSRNSDMVNAPYHELTGDTSSIISSGQEQEQESGLQLVHLLLACAEAIAKNDIVAARRYHHLLNRVVSPFGDSMQRVGSCFADALDARIAASPCSSSSPRPRAPFPPPALEVLKIYQIIYQACPYIKFAHFTANQAIFEAFESEDCVHVIDLDILQGYQWPAFLQALAARPGGAPALRITGVGYPADAVRETGRHLAELAHSLRVPFEFHAAAVDHLEDLRPSMLHRRVGEALAVNSVNRLHRVPGAHLGPLLAMIRDQAPKIFTLVEQEASHNGPYFLGRFLEALHYYSAIFDSLDATFPADSAARAKVEQLLLAPEIGNIVACEGSERVARHERLERWRRVMEGRVFKGVPLSANAVNQSKILLGLYPCDGYRLTEDNGCLLLGWQDRPIIAASAWRC